MPSHSVWPSLLHVGALPSSNMHVCEQRRLCQNYMYLQDCLKIMIAENRQATIFMRRPLHRHVAYHQNMKTMHNFSVISYLAATYISSCY